MLSWFMVNNLVAVFPVYNDILVICIVAIVFAIKFMIDIRKEDYLLIYKR